MLDFIRANAGDQAKAGKPLVVTVDTYKAKRSNEANARYWALLEDISEQAVIEGKRFSRETWHEYFKSMFSPKIEGPSGLLAASTTQMDAEQFHYYAQSVEVHAVQTLGVEFATA